MTTSFIEERRAVYAGFGTRELAVAGNGPTILLVHGFGDAADGWRLVLDLLQDAGQAAVAVDLPGFGQADPLDDGALLPQLDAFLADVIRHYGRAQGVVVVGNSLGAAGAVRAVRDHGLPIAAVMTLGVAGVRWKPLTASINVIAVVLRVVATVPVPIPGRPHQIVLRRTLSPLLYGERSAVDPRVVASIAGGIADVKTTHRLVQLGAMFKAELDRTHEYGGIGVPMTVVHGARDRLVPVSASRVLHEANPGSRLVVLRRAGHCPQLDAADVVAHHARELAVNCTANKEIS
jgi:pimeloyl-ACP methyl ester carboxylesterase